MERVNREYIMINKIDLLCSLNGGYQDVDVIKNMLSCIFDYEKDTGDYVSNFYLNINSPYYIELSKMFSFPIKRNSLLNAFIYAGYTKNLQMIFNLNSFLSHSEVSIDELGNLSDYVLDYSIDFNEYIDGQNKRLVFHERKGFYEDYIYDELSFKKNNSKRKLFK